MHCQVINKLVILEKYEQGSFFWGKWARMIIKKKRKWNDNADIDTMIYNTATSDNNDDNDVEYYYEDDFHVNIYKCIE